MLDSWQQPFIVFQHAKRIKKYYFILCCYRLEIIELHKRIVD
jgi:hypothetical protein